METELKYPPYFDRECSPWTVAEDAYQKMEDWFQESEGYCVAFNEWLFRNQADFFEQLGLNNLQGMNWWMVIPTLFGWQEDTSFDAGNIIEYLGADTTKVDGFQVMGGEVTVKGDTVLDALAAFDLEIGQPFILKNIIINTKDETIELVALVANI